MSQGPRSIDARRQVTELIFWWPGRVFSKIGDTYLSNCFPHIKVTKCHLIMKWWYFCVRTSIKWHHILSYTKSSPLNQIEQRVFLEKLVKNETGSGIVEGSDKFQTKHLYPPNSKRAKNLVCYMGARLKYLPIYLDNNLNYN